MVYFHGETPWISATCEGGQTEGVNAKFYFEGFRPDPHANELDSPNKMDSMRR